MPSKPRLVVDASVAVKWLHEENNTDKALQLLNQIMDETVVAVVPDLIIYEVANVLVRGIGKPLPEAHQALDLLATIPWQVLAPLPSLLKDAVQFAADHAHLSLYDAMYVAVALHHDAVVITADSKLHRIVGHPLTRLL